MIKSKQTDGHAVSQANRLTGTDTDGETSSQARKPDSGADRQAFSEAGKPAERLRNKQAGMQSGRKTSGHAQVQIGRHAVRQENRLTFSGTDSQACSQSGNRLTGSDADRETRSQARKPDSRADRQAFSEAGKPAERLRNKQTGMQPGRKTI